jgi:hypothetical protein
LRAGKSTLTDSLVAAAGIMALEQVRRAFCSSASTGTSSGNCDILPQQHLASMHGYSQITQPGSLVCRPAMPA